jgi:hypothetical protein
MVSQGHILRFLLILHYCKRCFPVDKPFLIRKAQGRKTGNE